MKLFAKKSLGQHFLNSAHVLRQIIDASRIKTDDVILEIGPGTGILTRALLDAGALVVAIEKDTRTIDVLRNTFNEEISSNRLTIVEGDILEMNKQQILSLIKKNQHQESFAIVSNIPYYITGAILEKFLEYVPRPNYMVLLVQKEVAERIIARNGKESILSVSVKAFGTPSIIAKVPPGAFTPPPTVDSAILAISDISDKIFTENKIDIQRFFKIVKAGFAHKRKYALRNVEHSLGKDYAEYIWNKLEMDPKIRAEDINLKQWIDISAHK